MKRSVLLIGSLLLSVLFVEGILRIAAYDVNTHPFWKYHPELGWVIGKDVHFDQVNATGFRHSPVSVQKPAGTRRVMVLGDSFTLGTSLEYSQTFPGILEHLLGDTGNWEVLALAVDDWGWAQQLIALENYGLEYSPDLVVSQLFPLNDFCNNCLATVHTCSMQDHQRPYFVLRGNRLHLTSRYPWRKILRDRFKLAGLLENLFFDPWAQARRLADDHSEHPDLSSYFELNARSNGLRYPDSIQSLLPPEHQQDEVVDCWTVSQKILARMESLTGENEIAFLAAVIPFLYTFEERWPELQELSSAPIKAPYATERTEKILAELKVPAISVRSRIAADGSPAEQYFISLSDGHLSQYGHSRLASWILEEMDSLGMIENQ